MSNPAGWMVEISGADKFFYSEKSALNARRRYEREMDAEEGVKPYAVYAAAPVSPIAGVRWTYHGSEPQAELLWFSAGEVAPGGDVTHELYASAISVEPEEGDHEGRQLEWERCENKRLREALSAARNDLLAVSHLVPGDYIQKSVSSADAAIASAKPNNQCDGCRAGIPLINGMHRMGKPGEYPDFMSCTSKRYDYDPDEPANKESAQ